MSLAPVARTRILFLYSEVVGYLIPLFRVLAEEYNATVKVVHWDHRKLKPYTPPVIDHVEFVPRSRYSRSDLLQIAREYNPVLTYVSGWMDPDYLAVCKFIRRELRAPVVSGFDDKWTGSLRQVIGSLVFPYLYRQYFSNAWVAGPYQYHYVRNLGFKDDEIIFDLLSANTHAYSIPTSRTKIQSPNPSFIYVGNFRLVKGTDILLAAYKLYREQLDGRWSLTLIGNGELEEAAKATKGVIVHPYSSEDEIRAIADTCSVFILPSRNDQWGVVVHEFALLGFPMILSTNVGARAAFFIDGFNGISFESESVTDLARCMKQMETSNDATLTRYSRNSMALGSRISNRTSAANLMSIQHKAT